MFFKGIKYPFLFLVCLFAVDSILNCQGGKKGSATSGNTSPTRMFYDPIDDSQGPSPFQRVGTNAAKEAAAKKAATEAAQKAQEELEIARYKQEMDDYNQRREIELQRAAFENSQQIENAQREKDLAVARARVARGSRNPTALSRSDLSDITSTRDPNQYFARKVAIQQAARAVNLKDLNYQAEDLRASLKSLKAGRLSIDEEQALQRNIDQAGEITKKLSALNKEIKFMQEGGSQPSVGQSTDAAFLRMMQSQYPRGY